MYSGRKKAAAAACVVLLGTVSTAAIGQTRTTFTFNQPAESLSQALRDVAVRTGRNVIAPDTLIGPRQAPALSGSFTAEGAVTRLLLGSGLQLTFSGDDLIVATARDKTAKVVAGSDNPTTITVTGTRIRGAGSASPVVVATRSELEKAGITSLADFTRVLPQNYTGGQNQGIAGDGEQAGQSNLNNSANFNLRGLGPDATLTLFNGHRLSYDGVDQGVDIAAIPLSALDRIEVVSDGASALYGSDAVAGVANVILRRDYEGLETTARIGGSSDGGDFQQEYSLVGGHRWLSGGFMVALDQSDATPITAGQRTYTRTLDPSLFLTDRTRQSSAVVSFHQQISSGLSFEFDGSVMDRKSLLQSPFSPTKDVHVSGLVNRSQVKSYALTPTLKADLGAWQANLSGTVSDSRTFLAADDYFNSVPAHSHILYEDNLKGLEGTGEGPLFALPGGDARLTIGAGARTIWFHDRQVNGSGAQNLLSPSVNKTQSRNVQFAYGELSLPLVGSDLHLPLIDRLTLSAALRYEHWNQIASVTTPKLGAIYQPVPDLTFRATWGKSFKIPTLYTSNQPVTAGLYPGYWFNPPPKPLGSVVLTLGGTAPHLKPERATTWEATVELKPRALPGLALQATYFRVDYRDRIADPLIGGLTALYNPLYSSLITYNPSTAEVNAALAMLTGQFYNYTGAPLNPANISAILNALTTNTERQKIHGVDFNADYHVDFGPAGKLFLSGAASYLESYQQLAPNRPLVQLAGTIFHPPHWHGRGGVGWEGRHSGFAAYVNYLGPATDNTFTNAEKVGAFTTLDISASLRTSGVAGLLHDVELRLTALNVLNEKPHHIRDQYPQEAPYDSTNESPVGRFIGASLRKVW